MGSRKNRLANEELRLKQAALELKERAANRRDLANAEKSRIQQSSIEAKERVEEKLALQNSIAAFLNEKNIEHKAMSNALIQAFEQYRTDRQSDETERIQEQAEFQNNIKAKVNDICQEVQMSLQQFHSAHIEMTKSLQKEFRKNQKNRLSAEKDRQDIATELAEELATNFSILQQDTVELLKSFNTAHREMSKLQQNSLNTYIQNMKTEYAVFRQQVELDQENRLEFLYELLDLDFGIKEKIIWSDINTIQEIVEISDTSLLSNESEITAKIDETLVKHDQTLRNEVTPETDSASIEVSTTVETSGETSSAAKTKIFQAGNQS